MVGERKKEREREGTGTKMIKKIPRTKFLQQVSCHSEVWAG